MDPATLALVFSVAMGLLVEPGWKLHPQAKLAVERQHGHAQGHLRAGGDGHHEGHAPHPANGTHSGGEAHADRPLLQRASALAHPSLEEVAKKAARLALASGVTWLRTGAVAAVLLPGGWLALGLLRRASQAGLGAEASAAAAPPSDAEAAVLESATSASELDASPFGAVLEHPMAAMFVAGAVAGLLLALAASRWRRATRLPQKDAKARSLPPAGSQLAPAVTKVGPTLEEVFNSDMMGGKTISNKALQAALDVNQPLEQYAMWTPQVSPFAEDAPIVKPVGG